MTDIESLPLLNQKVGVVNKARKYKIYLVTIAALFIGSILLYDIAGQHNSNVLIYILIRFNKNN